jgi:EAL domain-containing protein (putative c-di-GMP-specific phosphodiesterase class I)
MAATAEGVETREQLAAIKSEGCTEMQGYLFSQPVPASEIERLFISKRLTRKRRGGTAD